ncbi:MAG: hypothetical protein J6S29_04035 [Methanosphaera sp.]|nr:hypothetical protein [Methanosphaera sp.]
MKNTLRAPKGLKKDPNYLLKEKKIIKRILLIAFIIVILSVLINLFQYLSIIKNIYL